MLSFQPVIGTSSVRLGTSERSKGFFIISLVLSSLKSIDSSGSESLPSSFFGLLNIMAVDLMDRSIGWSWSMATPATAGEWRSKSPPLRFCQVASPGGADLMDCRGVGKYGTLLGEKLGGTDTVPKGDGGIVGFRFRSLL